MLRSMTGYGKAEARLENGKLTVEIRSLNAKSADIALKTSLIPKDKELPLRKKIADRLQFRGADQRAVDAADVAPAQRKLAVQDELVAVIELLLL